MHSPQRECYSTLDSPICSAIPDALQNSSSQSVSVNRECGFSTDSFPTLYSSVLPKCDLNSTEESCSEENTPAHKTLEADLYTAKRYPSIHQSILLISQSRHSILYRNTSLRLENNLLGVFGMYLFIPMVDNKGASAGYAFSILLRT